MEKDTRETDALQQAKNILDYNVGMEAGIDAAIAYAMIALVERLDKLSTEVDNDGKRIALRIIKAEY